ncbi:MAG: hypothetical protein Q7I99_07415 [Acholeplasmataceae bacterium]|nr:hypothetical protein [Acholeplasmataceae bacterium]
MFSKNRNLSKFSDVGSPEIVITINSTRTGIISIQKGENKTEVIEVVVDQAKGVSKD